MSRLRVISGKAKGRRLRLVPGGRTRPVGDRVKEALFNILGPDIRDARLLDMFAGTGSVGIEALSRGASQCLFLEANPSAVETIQANLEITSLGEGAQVIRCDALGFISREPDRSFDYVYVAPPQYRGIWITAVEVLDRSPGWLAPDAWIIAQIDRSEYESLALKKLVEFDRRRYGSTLLVFYELPGE